MKKILFILSMVLFVTTISAQQSCDKPCESTSTWGSYAGISLSMTNSFARKEAFNQSSFAGIEVGITKNNLSLGLGFGKANLAGGDVYIEPKMSVILVEKGLARGYFTLGVGCITDQQETFFTEYGTGILFKVCSRADVLLQYSNWAGINYVSTGFNFTIK